MADANKNALKVFNPSCARHVPAITQSYDYDYKTWLPLQVNSSICLVYSDDYTLVKTIEITYINLMIFVYLLYDRYDRGALGFLYPLTTFEQAN